MPTNADAQHQDEDLTRGGRRPWRLRQLLPRTRRARGRSGIAAAVVLLLLALTTAMADDGTGGGAPAGVVTADRAALTADVAERGQDAVFRARPHHRRHRWWHRWRPRPTPSVTSRPTPTASPTVSPTTTPGSTTGPSPTGGPTTSPSTSADPEPSTSDVPTPTTAPSSPSTSSFPDASTTGPRGALTVRKGDLTITEDGTVIENVELHGSILVRADNVTIRNSKIVSDGYWPVRTIGKGLLVEDTTIVGSANSQASLAGNYFVGRRLNLYGAPDGIKMTSGGEIYDSYIHDLADTPGAHNDGIDAGGPVKIVHNTVLVEMGQTSAIMLSEYGSDPDTDVLVKNNLIGGAGYTFYGGAPDPAAGHEVVDNLFTTRFYPRSGYYGPVAHWRSAGNTWANNRWADGPLAGQLVTP